jgi:hypothetical protein
VGVSDNETSNATAVVHVTYHLMPVAAPDTLPSIRSHSDDGLVYALPDALMVLTGIHTGVVNVAVEPRLAPPEAIAVDEWDEVAEYSVDVPNGVLQVGTLMSELPEGLLPLTAAGPGSYRVRVHARGRDTDIDGTAFEPFEDYRLVCWPARLAPSARHKQTDQFGSRRGNR